MFDKLVAIEPVSLIPEAEKELFQYIAYIDSKTIIVQPY